MIPPRPPRISMGSRRLPSAGVVTGGLPEHPPRFENAALVPSWARLGPFRVGQAALGHSNVQIPIPGGPSLVGNLKQERVIPDCVGMFDPLPLGR
jgi:hypothetical protein